MKRILFIVISLLFALVAHAQVQNEIASFISSCSPEYYYTQKIAYKQADAGEIGMVVRTLHSMDDSKRYSYLMFTEGYPDIIEGPKVTMLSLNLDGIRKIRDYFYDLQATYDQHDPQKIRVFLGPENVIIKAFPSGRNGYIVKLYLEVISGIKTISIDFKKDFVDWVKACDAGVKVLEEEIAR